MSTKSLTTLSLASAVLGAAAFLALSAGQSFAQNGPAPVPGYDNEMCFGISMAGKNDCQTASGSCAGTASADNQKDAWIYVPVGTCDKIVGASLKPQA